MTARAAEPRQPSRHRILARLGQGGTADVYLAVAQGPSGFNKLVVLKVLRDSLQADPEFAQMFQNEARLSARLNHPNIVQTYEALEENGVPMLVMEYLEGQPLSAIIRRTQGELPLAMHVKIIAEMLAGLHYAHELRDFDGTPLGVVHRDATPHNVFVTFEGQVKVLDFGIAKLDVSNVETRAGTLKGKIRYMAPEQVRGKPIDRRVDIYSAGAMLWQAATGEVLWKDLPEPAVIARILEGNIPPPRSLNPNLPASLERICLRAMAYEREDRYATAAELAADLEGFVAELGEPVYMRDVGKLVSRFFADTREATKSMIEGQLSVSSTWTGQERFTLSGDVSAPRSGFEIGRRLDRLDTGSASRPYSSSDLEIEEIGPRPSQRRRWAALGGVAALGLLGLGAAVFSGRSPSNAAAPVDSAVPLAGAPRPPLSGTLSIQAFPSEAKLFLDGEPLASNPFSKTLTLDGAQHSIRVEAPKYQSATRSFVMNQSVDFTITLDREKRVEAPAPAAPAPAAAAKRKSVAPTPAPPPPAPPKPATPSKESTCRNPFFIDSSGIKRVLPECL